MNSILYQRVAGKHLRFMARYFFIVIAFCAQAQDAENPDDFLSQIESLQSQMNIHIAGLEKIDNDEKIRLRGSLDQQLRQVLASYNHVISRNAEGQVDKVVIIGKKQNNDTGRIVLPTRYEDGHFLVSVSVSGHGKFWETLDMIIDTGADLVVLPESMLAKLGLADDMLVTRKMQTANGKVDAKVGKLQEVRIAGEILNDVAAAFVDDHLLSNKSLLGMSALGRYRLVIDNKTQLVMLFKK